MKIKIVSDGTRGGTKVINAETGELIEKVFAIYWNVEAGELPIATIKVLAEVELVVDDPDVVTREWKRPLTSESHWTPDDKSIVR